LKLLGLTYDGVSKEIIASTKIKKDLKITQDYLKEIIKVAKLHGIESKYGTFNELFTSKIGGMIQARLYNGSLETGKLEQDFSLKLGKGSLGYNKILSLGQLEFMNRFDIFNHSSYASHALYNVLSRRKSIIRKIPFASKLTHSISPTIRKYARLTIITKQ
jgi:hypothetical protein